MLDTINAPATGKVTEPAKAWANKWRVLQGVTWTRSKDGPEVGTARAGEIVWSHQGSPSRDEAESAATEYMLANIRAYGKCLLDYLGAYPLGEAP